MTIRDLESSAERLAALLPLLQSLSLGESELAELFATPPTKSWHSIELIERPDVHATLFGLRAGAVIPLHDHPRMTVLGKVLHGRMRVSSLEWETKGFSGRRLGTVDVDSASAPLSIRDSLHEITALTDCAFIDLFSPWYDDDSRPCTYWRIAEEKSGVVALVREER
jgi:cysteamine dioxygenase